YGTWIVTQPFTNGQMFYFPPGPALLASLYDASKGIFSHNPSWIFVFAGLPIWWKLHRQSLTSVLLVVMPSLVIQSTFSDWSGGYGPPGRYLMNVWPLFIPALAFFIQWIKTVPARVSFGIVLSIQLALAAYYILYKLVWWPAGERSPLFVMIENNKHIKLDSLFPNFGHELQVASRLDWAY